MKIFKYLHSCLLLEALGKAVLIDPGIFTSEEHALEVKNIQKLNYLLITHEHPDHMYVPLIKELVANFPKLIIVSNVSVAQILGKENITVQTEGDEIVSLAESPHEKLWDKVVPSNTVFKVFGRLTDPGDSLHFSTTTDILALPITAPWGSTTAAVEKAKELKPKIIIPVHDWMWKDEVRKGIYARLSDYFKTIGIDFKGLETGEIIEV
jgi:L-ascorbate metabolism protein UlaG (beta-lactamase superfamily)